MSEHVQGSPRHDAPSPAPPATPPSSLPPASPSPAHTDSPIDNSGWGAPAMHDELATARMAHQVVTELDRQVAAANEALSTEGDPARQGALRQRIARLQSDIATLSTLHSAGDAATLRSIAGQHDVEVDPETMRVGTEHEPISRVGTSEHGLGYTRGAEVTTSTRSERPDAEEPDTHTERTATTTSAGLHGVHVEHEQSTSDRNSDGEHEHSTTTSGSIESRDGGVELGGGRDRRETTRQENGASQDDHTHGGGHVGYGHDGLSAGGDRSREETTRRSDGSGDTQRSSTSAGITAGHDGISGNLAQTRSSTHTNTDGTTTSQNESSRVTGGIVTGDEHGVTGGVSLTRGAASGHENDAHENHDDRSRSTTVAADGRLTDHGAAGSGNVTHERTEGPASVGGSLGARGSFHIDITPIPGTQQVRVTTQVSWHASVGASIGLRNEHAGASVGGEASAGQSIEFTHVMSRQEADRYAERARAEHGGGDGEMPEFSLMARIRAAREGGALQPLSDAQSAAHLGDGDSVRITDDRDLTEHAGANLSAGGVGASGELRVGAGTSRTTEVSGVEVDGHRRVRIRLAFHARSSRGASGSAEVGVAGAHLEHDTNSDNGQEIVVDLDPAANDFDTRYADVMACHDAAAAQRLANELGAEQTISRSQGSSTAGGVGTGGDAEHRTALDESVATSQTDAITFGARNRNGGRTLSANIDGERNENLAIDSHGHRLLGTHDQTDFHGHADADHTQADVTVNRESDGDALPAWLRDRLHTHWQEVSELSFSRAQLEQLSGLAASRAGWVDLLPPALHVDGGFVSAWQALGNGLTAPRADPQLAQVNASVANEIARLQALRQFETAASVEQARQALLYAMRGDGRRIGTRTDWATPEQAHEYDALTEAVDGAPERWHTLEATAVQAEGHALDVRITTLQALVQSRRVPEGDDFAAEAITATTGELVALRSRLHEAMQTAGAHPPGQDAAGGSAFDRAVFTTQLQDMKSRELQLWQQAQSRTAHMGRIFTLTSTSEDLNAAIGALDQISGMYPRWAEVYNQAVVGFRGHGVDVTALHQYRPNPEWSIALMSQAITAAGDDFAANEVRGQVAERSARWHEQCGQIRE